MVEYDEIVYTYKWRVFDSIEELRRNIPYAKGCTKRYRKYTEGYVLYWDAKIERIKF